MSVLRSANTNPCINGLVSLPADIDGDGDLDLASINGCSNQPQGVIAVLNERDGGVTTRRVNTDPCASTAAVWISDMDGDGRSDFVYASSCIQGDVTVVFTGADGGAEQTATVSTDLKSGTSGIALVDHDRDGRPDVVLISGGGANQICR